MTTADTVASVKPFYSDNIKMALQSKFCFLVYLCKCLGFQHQSSGSVSVTLAVKQRWTVPAWVSMWPASTAWRVYILMHRNYAMPSQAKLQYSGTAISDCVNAPLLVDCFVSQDQIFFSPCDGDVVYITASTLGYFIIKVSFDEGTVRVWLVICRKRPHRGRLYC